jgi:hypothetical protein
VQQRNARRRKASRNKEEDSSQEEDTGQEEDHKKTPSRSVKCYTLHLIGVIGQCSLGDNIVNCGVLFSLIYGEILILVCWYNFHKIVQACTLWCSGESCRVDRIIYIVCIVTVGLHSTTTSLIGSTTESFDFVAVPPQRSCHCLPNFVLITPSSLSSSPLSSTLLTSSILTLTLSLRACFLRLSVFVVCSFEE